MKAIVLSKTRYGEADLILRLLSQQGEAFSVMAKSALRSRRRFGGGVLEPLNLIDIGLQKRGAEDRLPILTEAQLIEDFHLLRSDYDRVEIALHFVKIVALVAKDGEQCLELFDLLGHALKAAQASNNLPKLKLRFDVKLLYQQGVIPKEGEWKTFLVSSLHSDGEEDDLAEFSRVRSAVDYYFQDYLG